MPALPLHEAGKYVAAAYIVVFALVLIYVGVMAIRLHRLEGRLGELLREEQEEDPARTQAQAQEPGAVAEKDLTGAGAGAAL